MGHERNDLFEYTSGRWIFNEALRLAERRRVFNIDGLRRLAAESVNRSPDDIVDVKKLAEGAANRTFLISMRDEFQMVARIPYPVTNPKYLSIASEVATMALLRSSGLPIPEVYGYSAAPDNAAETEYIFMEFIDGTLLRDIWSDLGEEDIVSFSRQISELEAKMMAVAFPAGGSLYYTKDLEKLPGRPGIPLEDDRFCVGPDTRLRLWYGRRSLLDVDRGPYENIASALVAGTNKELAFLKQFGRPLLPLDRGRREVYNFKEQLPSDYIENLNRYLLIAPSLIPGNPDLCSFGIRHPDLQPGNIIISRLPDSKLRIIGLIDWQHTPILPQFLLSGVPRRLENDDDVSRSMTQPSLPDNMDDFIEMQKVREKEIYRRRLIHYHYVKNTEEHNKLHYVALTQPMGDLRRFLFDCASAPWEGETLELKVTLIEATENWETLSGGTFPCPVVFDAKDVRDTMELNQKMEVADKCDAFGQNVIGIGPEGWVPTHKYDEVMERGQFYKGKILERTPEDEHSEFLAHWLLDDRDEEQYM